MTLEAAPCPLCDGRDSAEYFAEPSRSYARCNRCGLIYLHPSQRLSPENETLRYMEHRNDRADPEYVKFLRRLGDPICDAVPVGARGLDFGCGPAPVLAELLTASGRPTVSHDPLFFLDDSPLAVRYDFVTCSEVVEHAHEPASLFAQLGALVRAGGTIGIMTRFYGHEAPFDKWWYRRDPTHVCFYDEHTMEWIAERFAWTLALPVPNVAMFTTPR